MSDNRDEFYLDREQTRIKHAILEKYLERFARIVGQRWEGILYIDGFSGPWNTVSNEFSDSSFAIALRELRSARDTVRQVFGKDLSIQCVFLEKDPVAFKRLQQFASEQADAKVTSLNLPFEDAVPELVRIIETLKVTHFPFILIDPRGWKGFSMDVITPLVRCRPCEVLVNFMTGHIRRFIEAEGESLQEGFHRLFGDKSHATRIAGLTGQEREDEIVAAYAERLATVGGYPFFSTTLVLEPTRNRTYYHLIYTTRNVRGIHVFKDAERNALKLSEVVRADAKRRAREDKSGQSELFGGRDLPETDYLARLQVHFESLAERALSEMARTRPDWSYDEVYALSMRWPIVQESFLKKWIKEHAEVLNLGSGRSPKVGSGHIVRFKGC